MVHVVIDKTVGVMEILHANISLLAGQSAYAGPFNITVWDHKGARLPSVYLSTSQEGMVGLQLSHPGNTTITFQAANDVSMVSTTVHLLVVGECVGRTWLSK